MSQHQSSRSERRRRNRRQRLINAARSVIADKGVAGLTVSDVTEAADVAVGSFYTYFAGKSELIETAIWEDMQRLGNPDLPELQGLPPLRRAAVILEQTYAFVEKHRPLMQAVFGPGSTPDHFHRGLDLVSERVATGLQLQTHLPADAIAWLSAVLGGMIVGGIRYALDHPDIPAQELAARTMRLLQPLQQMLESEE